MLVFSLIALYVLIPQFADVTGMFRQLKDANWALVGGALVFSVVTYVGAAISLIAACPVPVRPFNAVEVAFAGSFVNRITPGRDRGHRPQPPLHAEGGRQHRRSSFPMGCERAGRRRRAHHARRDVHPVGGQGRRVRLLAAGDAAPRRVSPSSRSLPVSSSSRRSVATSCSAPRVGSHATRGKAFAASRTNRCVSR